MRYFTVEGIVFSAWCEHHLPWPRGRQIAHQAQFQGMAAAIQALLPDELATWITRRDQVEAALGTAFLPDATLTRSHFYEQARERVAAARRRLA
jgi:hypothetical protein